MNKPLTYRASGVSYDLLDTFKRLAQAESSKTDTVSDKLHILSESRGEAAFVWEETNCFRAFVMEGLGTKNLVADEMRKITRKTYYDAIAQDTVAMIVNDLIVVGATPQVVNAYFAVGSSEWFADTTRAGDLARGWARACKLAGAVWGGGETPTLKGVIDAHTIDLAGASIGIIKPKSRLVLGDTLRSGDAIVLVESSGIHANGLTLAREIVKKVPYGYAAKLSDRSLYGEALLTPTYIYARLIDNLFTAGVDIHYMVNITGHGWRKLMRAQTSFTYRFDTIPTPHPIFTFIQKHSGVTIDEMYANFNMGAGFALYIREEDVEKVMQIAAKNHLRTWRSGTVVSGPKQVVISPLGITYKSSTLQIRSRGDKSSA